MRCQVACAEHKTSSLSDHCCGAAVLVMSWRCSFKQAFVHQASALQSWNDAHSVVSRKGRGCDFECSSALRPRLTYATRNQAYYVDEEYTHNGRDGREHNHLRNHCSMRVGTGKSALQCDYG